MRYTQAGSVIVSSRVHSGRVQIRVSDTGPGIPADEQEAIFREFYQATGAWVTRHGGLGLGLAVVRRSAQLIDASIGLESSPGQGSVFCLVLPLLESSGHDADDASRSADALVDADQTGADNERAMVVVVDDDEDIRQATFELLQSRGYRAVVASSVSEAIELLDRSGEVPDLVISDHWLRQTAASADTIAGLRQHYNRNMPAIVITGETTTAKLREIRAQGFTLLNKPLSPAELLATIRAELRAANAAG